MANNKKHVKRIFPKHLTICVPEPEDDLVEFFQREVQNSMQKGVFRNHAIIASSVAIDYMLLLINDGEFEEPDDLGFRLMLLHDFVSATYGIDNVIMMSFDFCESYPKWISIAKSVILKIDSDRADSAFKLFPKFAKEDLLLLEQYIFSKNGTSLIQFSYNKQGYSDACFTSIEESDGETYELDMREIRNKLVAAFAFDDAYILFSYFDEDDIERKNMFRTIHGSIRCVPVDLFSDPNNPFADEFANSDPYIFSGNNTAPIQALAPLVFSGKEFELDSEALNRAMEEKGYVAL